MDMGRILSIFNNMKNVNMSGTPASEEAAVAPETRNVVECSNCIGSGQIDLGWGETVPCRECQASGKIFENDRTVAYSGAEDEGPSGKYGAGQMWQKDEMDFPPESFFKTDIAGEKKHGEEANDHDLTVDDQLEQNGLEEGLDLTEGSQKCVRCGVETVAPGIKFCDDCYKVVYDIAADRASKSTLKRRHTDLEESEMNITETAPPDQEAWVKANKARFKKEYGDKKGEEVLYATAWKNHNKKKKTNECDGCSNPEQERDSISINGSFNSENNEKSVTVTARNQKADELMQILQLSGLTPNAKPKAEIAPVPEPVPVTGLSAVVVGESTGDIRGKKCSECKKGTYQETTYHDDHDGVLHCNKCGHEVNVRGSVKEAFSEFPPELDDQEAERNSMYCDQCGGYHSGNCPREPMEGMCKACGENETAEGNNYCEGCHELGHDEDCADCGRPRQLGIHQVADEEKRCADCYRYAHEEDQFRTPEPDDFEEMNRNEADDYMNESEEYNSLAGGSSDCEACGSCLDPNENFSPANVLHGKRYCDSCFNEFESGRANPNCHLCHENEAFQGSKFCSACASGEGMFESKLNEAAGYYVQGQSKGTDRNRFKYRDCWVKLNPHRENSSDPDFIIVFGKQYATIFDDLGEAKKYAANAKSIFNLHGVSVKPQMADVIQWPNKVQESKKVINMNEALTPKREGTGLNGAPKTWQNEPNEQMAGWKALVQDTDGLSQPHDMFNAVKGSDNIMTVATKKKGEQEKPSGDFSANALALAEKLQKKFDMLEESDDSVERMTCCKCGKNTSRFNCRCGHKLCSSCKDAPPNKKKPVKESEKRTWPRDYHETKEGDEGYCTNCGKEQPNIKEIDGKQLCSDCRKKSVKEGTLKEDFCISCDKRIPSGSDIDQCKKCYAKDHPEEGKTNKKVAETVDNLGTSKKVCKICGKKAGSHTEAGEKKCLAALDKKEGKKKVSEASAQAKHTIAWYRKEIEKELASNRPNRPRIEQLKKFIKGHVTEGVRLRPEATGMISVIANGRNIGSVWPMEDGSGWNAELNKTGMTWDGISSKEEAVKGLLNDSGVIYESTASKVAKNKEDHPEKFCKTKKCLYRTDAEYCPKHKPAEKVTESVSDEHEVFLVHIPANVYSGKYYDYRSYPYRVFKGMDGVQTEQDAIDWVNNHKDIVLAAADESRVRAGDSIPKIIRRIKKPADKNVFFKNTYHVTLSKVTFIGNPKSTKIAIMQQRSPQ